MEKIKEVTIYTDGACDPNPGPGGYRAVLIFGHHRKELSGGFRQTTNNRMEIYAVIAGLQALKEPCRVKLFCDSEYVVKAMSEGWAHRWQANNWHRTKQEKAANHDLWQRVLNLCNKHEVKFFWIRGHSGIPENERCDQLSMQALRHGNLPIDEGYSIRRQSAQATLIDLAASLPPSPPSKKIKITREGQPCRKCSTAVIKKIPRRKQKTNQKYYYEYYFYCPSCHTMFMPAEAKKGINNVD